MGCGPMVGVGHGGIGFGGAQMRSDALAVMEDLPRLKAYLHPMLSPRRSFSVYHANTDVI